MVPAQQHPVADRGRTALGPVDDMMHLAPRRGNGAAGDDAAAVTGADRLALPMVEHPVLDDQRFDGAGAGEGEPVDGAVAADMPRERGRYRNGTTRGLHERHSVGVGEVLDGGGDDQGRRGPAQRRRRDCARRGGEDRRERVVALLVRGPRIQHPLCRLAGPGVSLVIDEPWSAVLHPRIQVRVHQPIELRRDVVGDIPGDPPQSPVRPPADPDPPHPLRVLLVRERAIRVEVQRPGGRHHLQLMDPARRLPGVPHCGGDEFALGRLDLVDRAPAQQRSERVDDRGQRVCAESPGCQRRPGVLQGCRAGLPGQRHPTRDRLRVPQPCPRGRRGHQRGAFHEFLRRPAPVLRGDPVVAELGVGTPPDLSGERQAGSIRDPPQLFDDAQRVDQLTVRQTPRRVAAERRSEGVAEQIGDAPEVGQREVHTFDSAEGLRHSGASKPQVRVAFVDNPEET